MMITLPDGSQEIRNPDGSLYMRFPPAVPSSADLEGWSIHRMSSTVRLPGVGARTGSVAVERSDVESFNGLLRLVREISRAYGYQPSASWFGTGQSHFRWTWEHRYDNGHHVSEMIIASKIH